MVEKQRLTELQLRKQILLLESELNRLSILEDLGRLQIMTTQVMGMQRNASKWATIIAPLAGLFFAWRARKAKPGKIRWLTLGLSVLPSLIKAWRKHSGAEEEEAAGESGKASVHT